MAEFGDNFKDGLHKRTFHEDGLHAPMEADNLKDGLHKPTFHENGLHAVGRYGDNFMDCLPKPTFMWMACTRH